MNSLEKRVYGILIGQGYLVEKPVRVYWHRVDLFGCWDFIAVNDRHIRFIQVSKKYFTDRPKQDQDKMLNFPCPLNCTKEYWQDKGKYKGMKIQMIDEEFKRHILEVRNLRKKK